MSYRVVFAPEAEEQIMGLFRYIAEHDSMEAAERFTTAIVNHCEEMRFFPLIPFINR